MKYFHKLKRRSTKEIYFRFRKLLKIQQEKLLLNITNSNRQVDILHPSFVKKPNLRFLECFKELSFFGLAEEREAVIRDYEKYFYPGLQLIEKQAQELLQHRFHLLGIDVKYSDTIYWKKNPQTDAPYPDVHYSVLDVYSTERYGDIKYVWELNRHQFLIELGKAYFLTGDEAYAHEIWKILDTWIDENPYKIGVNWTSALEAAVRVFSWIWALYFTMQSSIWNSQNIDKLVKNLLLHGAYIEESLSYYFSPYNHLIGELAALCLLGIVFPELETTQKWRDQYWSEMADQLDKQFFPDGMTVEQATYYHHFTLGFYLMVALLREQNNLPVSQHVWDKLEKAIEIAMYMTRPDGRLPMIGDIDNARSIYFYQPVEMWDLRAFLALGAAIFHRPDMKFVAKKPSEEILWMLGSAGLRQFERLSAQEPEKTSCGFLQSGYFILRDSWSKNANYLLFDCGKIAEGLFEDNTSSAAHGHADILSFELCINGQPILIDPGFHNYFGSLDWHRYFRSTGGHNTIEVQGKGQAVHEGRISWSRVSIPYIIHWSSTPDVDFVVGSLNRFALQELPICHVRYIIFRKSRYFLVVDEVLSKEPIHEAVKIESYLHFSPGDLSSPTPSSLVYNGSIVLMLTSNHNGSVEISKGGNSAAEGWTAKGYGYRSPAPIAKLNYDQVLPLRVGMLFPLKDFRQQEIQFSYEERSQGIFQLEVQLGNQVEKIIINSDKKEISLEDQNVS